LPKHISVLFSTIFILTLPISVMSLIEQVNRSLVLIHSQ